MMSVAIRDQTNSTHVIKFQPTFRVATMTGKMEGQSEVDTGRKRARGESSSIAADILHINVGGKVFVTSRKTLCFDPDSMIGKLFSDNNPFGLPSVDANGRVFIDRDGDAFVHVLNYLRRSGNLVGVPTDIALLARIKNEAEYFGLTGLVEQLKRCRLPDSVVFKGAFQDLAALGFFFCTYHYECRSHGF